MKTKFTALIIMFLSLVISSSVFAEGYLVTSDLWIRAVINTIEKGPIEAVWRKGGEDTTSRGDQVVWGHFYASPSDVTWGSQDNPDLFVKIWFDVSGRVDVNFFHVSVPEIEVYSDMPDDDMYDQKGTTTMDNRYIRHEYRRSVPGPEAQATIGPEGGVIEVTDPYSPIAGTRLYFPAGALDQNTMFSLRYDALHDSKNLIARPVIIDHPDIQLHDNINVTLPLREVPAENTTLMIMLFDDELNTYVPAGLLVDVVAGDTSAHFQIAHLSGFSLDEAEDVLKEMSNATLVFLITKLGYLSNAIDQSAEVDDIGVLLTFLESWDGLSGACEDKDARRMIDELLLSGIMDIMDCGPGGDITAHVHTLRSNKDKLLRALSNTGETLIISICDKVNGFHWAYYPDWFSSPEADSEYLKFRLVNVSDQGYCMGRCGLGCPGDGLPSCGNVFRYTQACLNHDACSEDFGVFSSPCMSILDYCRDDCLYAPVCENAGDCHKLDPDCDGCIDSEELAVAEEMWKNGEITIEEIMEATAIWKECTSDGLEFEFEYR
jgi:hypothetical protein